LKNIFSYSENLPDTAAYFRGPQKYGFGESGKMSVLFFNLIYTNGNPNRASGGGACVVSRSMIAIHSSRNSDGGKGREEALEAAAAAENAT
jgi:hypothetical protein